MTGFDVGRRRSSSWTRPDADVAWLGSDAWTISEPVPVASVPVAVIDPPVALYAGGDQRRIESTECGLGSIIAQGCRREIGERARRRH
jgi:hypothetical protein